MLIADWRWRRFSPAVALLRKALANETSITGINVHPSENESSNFQDGWECRQDSSTWVPIMLLLLLLLLLLTPNETPKKTESRVLLSISELGPSTNGKDLKKRKKLDNLKISIKELENTDEKRHRS